MNKTLTLSLSLLMYSVALQGAADPSAQALAAIKAVPKPAVFAAAGAGIGAVGSWLVEEISSNRIIWMIAGACAGGYAYYNWDSVSMYPHRLRFLLNVARSLPALESIAVGAGVSRKSLIAVYQSELSKDSLANVLQGDMLKRVSARAAGSGAMLPVAAVVSASSNSTSSDVVTTMASAFSSSASAAAAAASRIADASSSTTSPFGTITSLKAPPHYQG